MKTQNSHKKFLSFLESLTTAENAILLETIAKGYKVIKGLYETPDKISIPKEKVKVHFRDNHAYAFIYLDEKGIMYISGPGMSHGDMILAIVREEQKKHPQKDFWDLKAELGFGYDDNSEESGYHGRYWTNVKVISFWKYPSADMFRTIISKLKEKGAPIDDTWRVEVKLPDNGGSLDVGTTLIPISEYTGDTAKAKYSISQKELDMLKELHVMDPIAKAKMPKRQFQDKDLGLGDKSMAEYNAQKQGSD